MAAVLCFALLVPMSLASHHVVGRVRRRRRLSCLSRRERGVMAAHAPARIERRAAPRCSTESTSSSTRTPRALELARAALDARRRASCSIARRAGSTRENLVRMLRALTREFDALLIMNDDWRAAIEHDCDGVHLGPGDAGFDARRRRSRRAWASGSSALSCGTLDEVRARQRARAPIISASARSLRPHSKADAGAPIGIGGPARARRATRAAGCRDRRDHAGDDSGGARDAASRWRRSSRRSRMRPIRVPPPPRSLPPGTTPAA